MGCVQSRKDVNDVHPDEFYVINIDDTGNELWAGELQITDSELILNRRGKVSTRWPLRSLRRYGFDSDVFSFESGRRCATGEGIYAFKCRRAEQLFNTLQEYIQLRNHSNENVLENLSAEPPSGPPETFPRPTHPDTLHLVPNHSDYLVPAPPTNPTSRFTGARLGSVGSGPLSPDVHSPGSPSSTNILEVMPLAPLPTAAAQVTNLYQLLPDFPVAMREHNNNKKVKPDSFSHSYLNTGDVNSDLAALRHSFQQPNLDDEEFNCGMAAIVSRPLSPTLSMTGEHYEKLIAKNGNNRLYMNLTPGETSLPAIHEETNGPNQIQSPMSNVQTPRSFNFDNSKYEGDEEAHNYANLGPGEVNYDPRLLNSQKKTARSKFFEVLEVPEVPPETKKINYAILDLDKTESETEPSPSSPKKPSRGYTIIDFNKTDALSSVAAGNEIDMEGSRKTRHNSTALPPSPTTIT